MRSTLEIVIAAKEQAPASDEELRLALVATSAMLGIVERELRDLVAAVLEGKGNTGLLAGLARRSDETRFASRKLPVDQYLGPSYTPGTPENLKLRAMAANVFEKATGEKL
jgi:hypothetical protein